jgi:type II restriction/modification system DNA methylase subunit YeeA
MTPNDFVKKWRLGGDERRDWHSFFNDVCALVGHDAPKVADPTHTWFTYEYGASKANGGQGWADAWKKGFFGWEAKSTGKDLKKAYAQLKMYSDSLENPPLLVVTDLQKFIIHTNFTNSVAREIEFTVDDITDPNTLEVLRNVFFHPTRLKSTAKEEDVTAGAAKKFAELADGLRRRGHDAHDVAHFLNRLVFCMFAEDILLLPEGLFTDMVKNSKTDPALFDKWAVDLFTAMKDPGGSVAHKVIHWFNGGLFNDAKTLPLTEAELEILYQACLLKWQRIDPSIFGTLFERGLDPSKRAELGAHYTDTATIERIVRPLIVEPWIKEWEAEAEVIADILAKSKTKGIPKAARDRFNTLLNRLRQFRVLDPACGSGNFLFMALKALKDVERRILVEAEKNLGLGSQFPAVGPANVMGIEINSYAAELARITVWIGEIQWMVQNGYGAATNPVLQSLDQIQQGDALITASDTDAPWPDADVIVGNPPFIGAAKRKGELGEIYNDRINKLFKGRLPDGSNFVCYWFEKARAAMIKGRTKAVGLVSTTTIRNGASRKVLDRIKADFNFLSVVSNEKWVNHGAQVRVSLITFTKDKTLPQVLNGVVVSDISASLKAVVHYDTGNVKRIKSNKGIAFQGIIPRSEVNTKRKRELGLPDASFVLDGPKARALLTKGGNPNGRPNSEVISRYLIGDDVVGVPEDRFIVNFTGMTEAQAMKYEAPFDAIETVKEHRNHMEGTEKKNWWLFARPRPAMLRRLKDLKRYIATPRVAKHRLFVWVDPRVLPDTRLFAITKDDSVVFGILHSRIHEVWSLELSSSHGVGNDPTYNAESCFETFPFPDGIAVEAEASTYAGEPLAKEIGDAADALESDRQNWLNPPTMVSFGPDVDPLLPLVRTVLPGHEAEMATRTLTALYNKRPKWLTDAHATLDAAVAQAYGWSWPMSDADIIKNLFELNALRTK